MTLTLWCLLKLSRENDVVEYYIKVRGDTCNQKCSTQENINTNYRIKMIWKVVKRNINSGWNELCFICTSYLDSTVLSLKRNQAFKNRFIRQIKSLQNQEN